MQNLRPQSSMVSHQLEGTKPSVLVVRLSAWFAWLQPWITVRIQSLFTIFTVQICSISQSLRALYNARTPSSILINFARWSFSTSENSRIHNMCLLTGILNHFVSICHSINPSAAKFKVVGSHSAKRNIWAAMSSIKSCPGEKKNFGKWNASGSFYGMCQHVRQSVCVICFIRFATFRQRQDDKSISVSLSSPG